MEQLATYFLWFMLYSMLGWVWETALCSITQGHFINRGFLNGPYCPIYGAGALVDIICLGWLHNPLLLFLTGAILACALEYATSYAMEYYFHARWWDYSTKRFNLNGRICLEGALVFGLFAVALILFIQPRISAATSLLEPGATETLAGALAFVFFFDLVYTLAQLRKLRSKLAAFQLELKTTLDARLQHARLDFDTQTERLRAELGELSARLRLDLNAQEQRMLEAFPNFRSTVPSLTLRGKECHSLLRLWRPQRINVSDFIEKHSLFKRN